MTAPACHPVRRLLGALLLGAFLATGSGAAGLELAWHIGHANDQHAAAPHFEANGGSAHADHCQLGLAHAVGRVPAEPTARFLEAPGSRLGQAVCPSPRPASGSPATGFPRAPPALG